MDIIIETPRYSTVKYKFEPQRNAFRLLKMLPAGFVFPYDFGFLPNTEGEDGDPLDVLVISELTTFPGCVMDCRIIGCLAAEQTAGNQVLRNDRYIAVPEVSLQFAHIHSIEQLPAVLLTEIKTFFTGYIGAEGKELKFTAELNESSALTMLTGLG